MEHFPLLLLCSALLTEPLRAEDYLSDSTSETAPQHSPALPSDSFREKPVLAIGGDQPQGAAEALNIGLDMLLIGDTEQASAALRQAESLGCTSPLLHVMQLMLPSTPQERKEHRDALETFFQDTDHAAGTTPQEEIFLKAFLAFVNGDAHAAAQELKEHALIYKRDTLAACWAIVLSHYAERSAEAQQENISFASERFRADPENRLLAYARAVTEEFFDVSTENPISAEALAAAGCAAEATPFEPQLALLQGHLEFHAGHIDKSLHAFREARTHGTPESVISISAGLYEATALAVAGRHQESLRLRREMNASARMTAPPQTPSAILRRWEVNTLPLRVWLKRPAASLTPADIKAAEKAATATAPYAGDELTQLYRDCLVQLLQARYEHRRHHDGRASEYLQLAEKKWAALRQAKPQGLPMLLTCYARACEACETGLYLVRAEIFSKTSDLWEKHAEQAARPNARLLPPVVPDAR